VKNGIITQVCCFECSFFFDGAHCVVVEVHRVVVKAYYVVGYKCSLCCWLSFSSSMNNQSMNIVDHYVANVHCVCLLFKVLPLLFIVLFSPFVVDTTLTHGLSQP
jgi:hypothetical protein